MNAPTGAAGAAPPTVKVSKKPLFPLEAPILALGRKTLVLALDVFKGQPQARLQEVKPVLSKDRATVLGWDREYGTDTRPAVNLTASPDELLDFLSEARGKLVELLTPAIAKKPQPAEPESDVVTVDVAPKKGTLS